MTDVDSMKAGDDETFELGDKIHVLRTRLSNKRNQKASQKKTLRITKASNKNA